MVSLFLDCCSEGALWAGCASLAGCLGEAAGPFSWAIARSAKNEERSSRLAAVPRTKARRDTRRVNGVAEERFMKMDHPALD